MDSPRIRSASKHTSEKFKPVVGGVLGDFKPQADGGTRKPDAKAPIIAGAAKSSNRAPFKKN